MTESTTLREGIDECLLSDRGVQQLQGCGVDTDLLPAVSHQKKEEKKTLTIIHQSFFSLLGKGGKEHHTLTDISEFSVTFHGSRDG